MNCIFMMLIEKICKLRKSLQVWSKRMESKVGIISHRQGKTRPYLWDIGTVKQKMVSASLLYFENLSYNDTLYSNNRKIFQRFETCKDIFTRHNGTGKTIGLGIATYSQPGDIQLPLDAVVDTFNISDKETAFYLVVCKHPLHY